MRWVRQHLLRVVERRPTPDVVFASSRSNQTDNDNPGNHLTVEPEFGLRP